MDASGESLNWLALQEMRGHSEFPLFSYVRLI